MNGIDGNEMNLASQSANSGRLQNPLSFYIESDRFEDFWASEWFEGILEAPDSEIMKNVTKMSEY